MREKTSEVAAACSSRADRVDSRQGIHGNVNKSTDWNRDLRSSKNFFDDRPFSMNLSRLPFDLSAAAAANKDNF